MTKKKIRVKVKKRKINIRRILICLLVIVLVILLAYYISIMPITNIYIVGNNILSDKKIIEISEIDDYPHFWATSSNGIIKKLKTNDYVKEVKVEKRLLGKIYIYVTEKKILCTYQDKLVFEDFSMIDNDYNTTSYPILISDVSEIKEDFIDAFASVNDDVLLKISEIEYTPNEVDDERFTLNMNDGNLVYITLNKIIKLNKYNSIYSSLDGKKGIIYLDSGDYVEVKE